MTDKKMSDAKNISTSKAKEMKARLDQETSKDHQETPAGDVYSKTECKDAETGVEKPTEAAVEESREWINENQR